MAKEIEFDWVNSSDNARNSKYPWNDWLNGKTWEIVRGTDFNVSLSAMRQAIWEAARIRTIKIRTKTIGDDKVILQAYKPRKPKRN